MSQVLSQDEVDALLAGISKGDVPTSTDTPTDSDGVTPYDLTSQDRIIRGRMPTLEIINERFARLFRATLGLNRLLEIISGGRLSYQSAHYPFPEDSWIRKEPRIFIEKVLMRDHLLLEEFLNGDMIRKIVTDHMSGRVNYNRYIYILLSLELWMKKFVHRGA